MVAPDCGAGCHLLLGSVIAVRRAVDHHLAVMMAAVVIAMSLMPARQRRLTRLSAATRLSPLFSLSELPADDWFPALIAEGFDSPSRKGYLQRPLASRHH